MEPTYINLSNTNRKEKNPPVYIPKLNLYKMESDREDVSVS